MANWFTRWRSVRRTPRVFISYRRQDSAAEAGLLFDRLQAKFGSDHVYLDIANIPLGMQWQEHIRSVTESSDVVLVLIGPNWLRAARRETGSRRLDEPDDFVRVQLATALSEGKHVVPVLLNAALMPRPEELPADIRELASFQSVRVSAGRDWARDCADLIRMLERYRG